MSLYHLSVTLHVLAAMLWLGGTFFLAAVGAPVLRRVQPPELRAEVFRQIGEQFRRVGWGSIAVLIVTGVANLHFRGLLHPDVLVNRAFWASGYGQLLGWKLGAVGLMLVLSVVHDFVVGPAASRALAGSAEGLRLRRAAAWLARIGALVGIVLVVVAVRLARGG